jgi:3-deoxy-D-manno-octulosonic-acid transferase
MGSSFILYNTLLHLATGLGFPFILYKLATTPKYRINLKQRLGFLPSEMHNSWENSEWIWLHAVSVGEVIAALPIVKGIKEIHPQIKVLLSTVTVTGYHTALEKAPWADRVIFFPFDYPWAVKRVINLVKPKLFLTMETELWPNFFHYLAAKNIPSAIINGRLSPQSYKGYYKIRFFMKKVLQEIGFFSMQTEVDAQRICELGAPREKVKVLGNVKFDQATSLATISPEEVNSLRQSLGLGEDDRVIIAGSTHAGEEEIIIEVFKRLKNQFSPLFLIIAPRHIERTDEIEELIKREGLHSIRRSKLLAGSIRPQRAQYPVIILDTLGELGAIYALATLVFVGGSLVPTGGQNLLEPAVHKKPVFFGPSIYNFEEIGRILKDSGAGIQIADGKQLTQEMQKLLQEPEKLRELGEKAQRVVFTHQGAVARNLHLIQTLLS